MAEMQSPKVHVEEMEGAKNSKRKAEYPSPGLEDLSVKRAKLDDDERPSYSERRDSGRQDRSPVEPKPQSVSVYDDPFRKSTVTKEDKKRGMRLFGGLLKTVGQTTTTAQQKKREEVERRQNERNRKRQAEDDQKKVEKLAKLNEIRTREQIKFDEQVVRLVVSSPLFETVFNIIHR
jgi:hypothetical protein